MLVTTYDPVGTLGSPAFYLDFISPYLTATILVTFCWLGSELPSNRNDQLMRTVLIVDPIYKPPTLALRQLNIYTQSLGRRVSIGLNTRKTKRRHAV